MARFGIQVASSGIIYHFYRNADYLVVGKFLGHEALGLYRVAVELAMTPAITLLQVVNRAALPVFARLDGDRQSLAEVFVWTQRNLAMLVIPVVCFLIVTHQSLLLTVAGASWTAAGTLVIPLALASWLRCHAQVYPQLFHATGRPLYAVIDSLAAMLVLGGGFVVSAWLFGEQVGVLAVCWVWLAGYPILIGLLTYLARRQIPVSFAMVLREAKHPSLLGAILLLVGVGLMALEPVIAHPLLFLLLGAVCVLGAALGYVRLVMGIGLKSLLKSQT
jgi:O-antigen/teichoic acid export membrane protein